MWAFLFEGEVIAFGFWSVNVHNMWSCHLLIAAVVSTLTKDGSVKFTQDNWK